jgi:DNA-directed RNA polymerase specialized sigma24 family protein
MGKLEYRQQRRREKINAQGRTFGWEKDVKGEYIVPNVNGPYKDVDERGLVRTWKWNAHFGEMEVVHTEPDQVVVFAEENIPLTRLKPIKRSSQYDVLHEMALEMKFRPRRSRHKNYFRATNYDTGKREFCDTIRFEKEYKRLIVGLCKPYRARLGDHALWVADDAFWDAFESWDPFDISHSRFTTYAYRVIKNALIDACEAQPTVRDSSEDEAWLALGVDPDRTPEDRPQEIDLLDPTASEALQNLCAADEPYPAPADARMLVAICVASPQRRRALLRHFEGDDDLSIALANNVSTQVIRQWRLRDLKRIRAHLKVLALTIEERSLELREMTAC